MTLDPSRTDFVLGNFEFALLHELAHIGIRELEIPIVGPEEQAADYIATMSLISPIESPPGGSETWLQFALNAADAFVILWELAEESEAEFPYWDAHALSIQRFYAIACLVYGSNPDRFAELSVRVGMPPQRAESCPQEYERASASIRWLRNYVEGQRDSSQQGKFMVQFHDPPSRVSQSLATAIRDRELVEWTTRRFTELVGVREDITLIFRACSVPEAAWIPESRELVICYEILDYYYFLSPLEPDQRNRIDSLLR